MLCDESRAKIVSYGSGPHHKTDLNLKESEALLQNRLLYKPFPYPTSKLFFHNFIFCLEIRVKNLHIALIKRD